MSGMGLDIIRFVHINLVYLQHEWSDLPLSKDKYSNLQLNTFKKKYPNIARKMRSCFFLAFKHMNPSFQHLILIWV